MLSVHYVEMIALSFDGIPASDIRARGGFDECDLAPEVFAAYDAQALSDRAMRHVANHKLWCKECKTRGGGQ